MVDDMSDDFSLNRLSVVGNYVCFLHNDNLKRFASERLPVGPTYRSLFIQPPMSTRNDVSTYIKYIPRVARLQSLDNMLIEMSRTDDPVFDTYIPSPSEYFPDDIDSFISPSESIPDNVDAFIYPPVYEH